MISYLELIDNKNLLPYALIEPLEFWGELSFYEVGECELVALATPQNIKAIKLNSYVKLANSSYLWVIVEVKKSFTAEGVKTIIAKCKEAKYILNKRAILKPIELKKNIAEAVYTLLEKNATGNIGARKIEGLELEKRVINKTINDTQAPRANLLEFLQELLKQNKLGQVIEYKNNKLVYKIIEPRDKTSEIIFSQSFDNLLASQYLINNEKAKSYCLVVSNVNDIDYTLAVDNGAKGIDRSEIIKDSNLSTKYEDANGIEQETQPTSELYKSWQREEAKKTLLENQLEEKGDGEIELALSNYIFTETNDYNTFFIGDLIKIKDDFFNYELNKRVLKYTIIQDKKYAEEIEYGE